MIQAVEEPKDREDVSDLGIFIHLLKSLPARYRAISLFCLACFYAGEEQVARQWNSTFSVLPGVFYAGEEQVSRQWDGI